MTPSAAARSQSSASSPTPAAACCRPRSNSPRSSAVCAGPRRRERRARPPRQALQRRPRPTTRAPARTRSGKRPRPTWPATRSSGRARSTRRTGGARAPRPGSTAADSTTSDPWLLIGPVPRRQPRRRQPELLASADQRGLVTDHHLPRRASASASDGLPYQARWYTQGDQPLDALPGNPSSPWEPLFTAPGEPTRHRHRIRNESVMQLRPTKGPNGKRRQWGADSHQNPMPVVPRIAGDWSMVFGRTAVVVTVAAWLALVITVVEQPVLAAARSRRRRRDRRLPVRGHDAGRVGDRLPVRPAGLLLPRQPPPPRAAGDDRRVLHRQRGRR